MLYAGVELAREMNLVDADALVINVRASRPVVEHWLWGKSVPPQYKRRRVFEYIAERARMRSERG